jgi:hypothetical protein
MNQFLKYIGIGLLVVFILWNVIFSLLVYSGGGCAPTYGVIASTQSEYNYTPREGVVHLNQSDVVAHPGLVDAFSTGKRILLPIGTVADLIPGSFFGSKYADTRVRIWERGYLEKHYTSVWEYNGSTFKLVSLQC